MKYLLVLFSSLIFTGCSVTKLPDESKPVMSLVKLQCLGICPTYKLSIYDNRVAVFEGYKHTRMQGKFKAKLSKKKYQELIDHFLHAGFFEMKDVYTAHIMDGQTTYVYFNYEGREKKILDYFEPPPELKDLEKLLEDLTKTEKWENIP